MFAKNFIKDPLNRKFTTHIIATSLAGVKLQKMRSDQIVVTPNWISDCLKQGKLLNTKPYVLATANLNKVKKSIDSHFTSSKGLCLLVFIVVIIRSNN